MQIECSLRASNFPKHKRTQRGLLPILVMFNGGFVFRWLWFRLIVFKIKKYKYT